MWQNDSEFISWAMGNLPQTPDGECEGAEISHEDYPQEHVHTLISMRNAIMRGQKPTNIRFNSEIRVRKLTSEEHGTWMTDSPQEVFQLKEPLIDVYGSVLVGGLGLGVASHLMMKCSTIFNVTTIEMDPRIIKLVKPTVAPENQDDHIVIEADLFKFVEEMNEEDFDTAFFDIWQMTGEASWFQYIVPLRRLCRNKLDADNIHCWLEDEMWTQMYQACKVRAHMDLELIGNFPPYVAFARACRDRKLPIRIEKMEELYSQERLQAEQKEPSGEVKQLLAIFSKPGTEMWERTFGDHFDAAVEEHTNKYNLPKSNE